MLGGEHNRVEIPEVSLARIIKSLPAEVVAYEWQLFLKRIANKHYIGLQKDGEKTTPEMIEKAAKEEMIEMLFRYSDTPALQPHNPVQMYMKETEFEAGIQECKEELLGYVHGTFKLENSHIVKRFLPEIRRMKQRETPENKVKEFEKDIELAKKLLKENVEMYNFIKKFSDHEFDENSEIETLLTIMPFDLSRIEDFANEMEFDIRRQYLQSYLYKLKRINKYLQVVNERI